MDILKLATNYNFNIISDDSKHGQNFQRINKTNLRDKKPNLLFTKGVYPNLYIKSCLSKVGGSDDAAFFLKYQVSWFRGPPKQKITDLDDFDDKCHSITCSTAICTLKLYEVHNSYYEYLVKSNLKLHLDIGKTDSLSSALSTTYGTIQTGLHFKMPTNITQAWL